MAFLLPFVGEEKRIDLGNANNGRDFKLFIFAYWSLQRSVVDVRFLFDGLSLGKLRINSGSEGDCLIHLHRLSSIRFCSLRTS